MSDNKLYVSKGAINAGLLYLALGTSSAVSATGIDQAIGLEPDTETNTVINLEYQGIPEISNLSVLSVGEKPQEINIDAASSESEWTANFITKVEQTPYGSDYVTLNNPEPKL